MNFVLFEDKGKFAAGREMSQADASSQIELETGRRIKVKAANILLRFKQPEPAALITQAEALSQEIDLDLVWEFAPEDEFSFIDFAKEYYDEDASTVQEVTILFALFGAPHYFRRAGRGCFRKAPEEQVKAALIAIERKEKEQQQTDAWATELAEGSCPEPVLTQLYKILFKPDKNALEYKSVVQASKQSQTSVLDLFKKSGAIKSAYEFHWQRFLYEFFPKGVEFDFSKMKLDTKAGDKLPVADVKAFSIDDSLTTEIDDALSVQGLGSGTVTMGIHIATPGLGITPSDALDQIARNRMSTVYMPGWKIPMLPQEVVDAFSLDEGHNCPALSLYVSYDEETLELKEHKTVLEQVPIALNMRYDQLDVPLNNETLSGNAPAEYPFADELAFLFRLAQQLKLKREEVRGKPETFSRPDYSFALIDEAGNLNAALPTGEEQVRITERERGSALDLVISEAMIVANCIWGGLMATSGVPGIYRSQYALRPGVKVRMSTQALPHAGIGVPQYAWSTSPLRRYTDLVNQWQIIACVKHGVTAALEAPFKPKDVELLSIISGFESAYSGYADYQRGIERYWTLRYLQQNEITELEGTIMRNGMVRANNLPLVFTAVGTEVHAKDSIILVRVTAIDKLTLDISAQFESIVQAAGGADIQEDDADDGEDEADAGPIAIAVDVNEEDAPISSGS